MNHRGRFQAQGDTLEESEPWAQNTPLKIADGRQKSGDLKDKIPVRKQFIRRKAFLECRKFIDMAYKNGGINVEDIGKPLKKSFVKNQLERVDIEIHKGHAFV